MIIKVYVPFFYSESLRFFYNGIFPYLDPVFHFQSVVSVRNGWYGVTEKFVEGPTRETPGVDQEDLQSFPPSPVRSKGKAMSGLKLDLISIVTVWIVCPTFIHVRL